MATNQGPREEDRVSINVGGTAYVVLTSTIMKYPKTMLGSMVSKRWEQGNRGEFFIDRDPIRFRYVLDFYRNGKITIPFTISKAEMIHEIEYFALPISAADIENDVSDISSTRETIHQFEQSIIDSLKEEAYNRSVEVCAYELAGLFIEKMKNNPSDTALGLYHAELPTTCFAKGLCPDVLNDPIFKETINKLVKNAGYHFVGEISSGHFHLSRSQA